MTHTEVMKLTEAEQTLSSQDPAMAGLIAANGTIKPRPERDYFEALASSIISQQISVKAAANIFGRFRDVTDLKPAKAVKLTDVQVKQIGLSGQKARYIHDLAEHFVRDSAVFNHLDSLSDDEVISELTAVKGIGVWTAQMFLIFTLRRPDVFAPDDRGLQIAIQTQYKLKELPGRAQLEKFAEKWAPYRTTASLHLWQSLDNAPG